MSKQPYLSLLMSLKSLMETLLVEQNCNSRMGSVICLHSVIYAPEGVNSKGFAKNGVESAQRRTGTNIPTKQQNIPASLH